MWPIVCDRPVSHRSLTKCPQWQIAMWGSCIAGFWTQGFSAIYMGKPVASRFGLVVSRIQDWRILIPFGNRVYDCLSQFRVMKNGRESLKLILKKVWRHEIRISAWKFPTRKIGECLFRRSVCFRNFPLKRRKQPETELMVSLAKHQSVLLVCFNGSCI